MNKKFEKIISSLKRGILLVSCICLVIILIIGLVVGLNIGEKSNNKETNGGTANEISNLVPGSTNAKVSLNNIGKLSGREGRSLFGGCENIKDVNRTNFENSVKLTII